VRVDQNLSQTKRIWLPILFTNLGWIVSWALGLVMLLLWQPQETTALGQTTTKAESSVVTVFIGFFLGTLLLAAILRDAIPSARKWQAILLGVGWCLCILLVLSMALGESRPADVSPTVYQALQVLLLGVCGGIAAIPALQQNRPEDDIDFDDPAIWLALLVVGVAWAGSWAISELTGVSQWHTVAQEVSEGFTIQEQLQKGYVTIIGLSAGPILSALVGGVVLYGLIRRMGPSGLKLH
jgi:hypothetical protein